jgi:hypothetical protein
VEEKLRAGKVSATTIAETMGFMNKAMGVLSGAAAAGKSVANDLMSATNRVVDAAAQTVSKPAAGSAPSGTSGASGSSAPGDTGGPVGGGTGGINPS